MMADWVTHWAFILLLLVNLGYLTRYHRLVLKMFTTLQQKMEALERGGRTLAPGETVETEVDLPPRVAELLAKGGHLTYEEGEMQSAGGGEFYRDLHIAVDGKSEGWVRVSWRGAGANVHLRPKVK